MHKLINIMLGMLIMYTSVGTMYAFEAELTPLTDELNTLADELNALAKALTSQVPPQPKFKTAAVSTSGKITNEKLWDKINRTYKFGKTNNQQYIGLDPYLYEAIYRVNPKTRENIEAAIINFLIPFRKYEMQIEYQLPDDQLKLIEDVIAHPENIDELFKKYGLPIPSPQPEQKSEPEQKPKPEQKQKPQPKLTTQAATTSGKITDEKLWAKINKTHKFKTPLRDRRDIGRSAALVEAIYYANPRNREGIEAAIMKLLIDYREGILQVEFLLGDTYLRWIEEIIADPNNWEEHFKFGG